MRKAVLWVVIAAIGLGALGLWLWRERPAGPSTEIDPSVALDAAAPEALRHKALSLWPEGQDERLREALPELLISKSVGMRRALAGRLMRLQEPWALEGLGRLARDQAEDVRRLALPGLRPGVPAAYLTEWRGELQSDDPKLRSEAAAALFLASPSDRPQALEQLRETWPDALSWEILVTKDPVDPEFLATIEGDLPKRSWDEASQRAWAHLCRADRLRAQALQKALPKAATDCPKRQ